MKNLTYYPFSRNRYFNGKLLTAQDFELEQRYMNDKRRLLNRWIVGVGVAAGLEVIQIDDYNISVEMGLAFDHSGREILVDAPVIQKLSLLDGYEEATKEEGNESLYLCIEYSQAEAEPVHNIHNDAVHVGTQMENGKYTERYHLYVTDDEPADIKRPEMYEDTYAYITEKAELIGHGRYERGIYLAKIVLVKAGEFYMIDKIVKQPFHQYVMDLPLTAGFVKKLWENMEELKGKLEKSPIQQKESSDFYHENQLSDDWQMSSGTLKIPVPEQAKAGDIFYSEEIAHGLGAGNVQLILEIHEKEFSYSGTTGLFEKELSLETACRLNRENGVFTVGIRLLKEYSDKCASIGWTAVRNRKQNEISAREARIFIKPAMVTMRVREVTDFSVVCVNMDEKSIKWTVASQNGGNIDENGRYHAPGSPGVYEIEAESSVIPGVKASVFVIVREV